MPYLVLPPLGDLKCYWTMTFVEHVFTFHSSSTASQMRHYALRGAMPSESGLTCLQNDQVPDKMFPMDTMRSSFTYLELGSSQTCTAAEV